MYKPSFFRNPSKPASERFSKGIESHFGPPMAPSKIASAESFIWKRHTKTIDVSSSKSQFAEFEFVLKRGCAIAQQLYRCAAHFRSDAITGEHRDCFPYSTHDFLPSPFRSSHNP